MLLNGSATFESTKSGPSWRSPATKSSSANIGLYQQEDVYRCSTELGYWLAEDFWGQGIATAAVNVMSELAFSRSDLVRIFACVFENNIGSCRVLEKAGFVLEGVHRRAVLKDGCFLWEKVYGLLREEWQEHRS